MRDLNGFTKNKQNNHIVSQPVKTSGLTFDDLYSEISDHWADKARKLQARRWRKIKHQAI